MSVTDRDQSGRADGPHPEDHPTPESDSHAVVRSEERLHVGTALQEVGRVLVRKLVGDRHDTADVDRDVEHVNMERSAADPGDTGEIITLPDGSVSIPVFEEEIVVQKRLVVRERVVLRKYTTTEREQVESDVRVERVEIIPMPEVADRVDATGDARALVQVQTAAEAPQLQEPAKPARPTNQAKPRTARNGTNAPKRNGARDQ